MELLLLQDIKGVGKKNDLVVVGDGFALNCLLPRRAALVATPVVRKRYADLILRRAQEKELEKSAQAGNLSAVSGKSILFTKKATKTGKLYAAISEAAIVDALKEQLNVVVTAEDIDVGEHIKTVGSHPITVMIGGQKAAVAVVVEAMKAEAK